MVSFNNFQALDPAASDLVRELLSFSEQQSSQFSAFLPLWMAFNGWMESVTQRDTDADMINDLARNQRLSDAFDALIGASEDFADKIQAFATMWPVWNVKDIKKKLGPDAFWRFSKPNLIAECEKQGVKREPRSWNTGSTITWSDLLRTIYQIRCNLFHGSKSPSNGRDYVLVTQSETILRQFLDSTKCLEWYDP